MAWRSARIPATRTKVQAPKDWPTNIPLLYFSYHVMAGLGTMFVALGIVLSAMVQSLAALSDRAIWSFMTGSLAAVWAINFFIVPPLTSVPTMLAYGSVLCVRYDATTLAA